MPTRPSSSRKNRLPVKKSRSRTHTTIRGPAQKRSQKKEQMKKAMRPGPVTRNPYLNFMREFRKNNSELSFTEMGAEGGKRWRSMDASEREVYEEMAQSVPKKEG